MQQRSGSQAYAQTVKLGGAPRETEARALTEAASRLFRARARPDDLKELNAALVFNLRLWNILIADMIEPDNPLPNEIKSNLYNLFLFVDKRTIEILNTREIEKVDALISVNREIARGLA
jgi:flagellar protein FlaF